MAEEGFNPIIIGLILAGLFAIAIINGGIMISEQNDFSGSIGDDARLSSYKESITNNLTAISTTTDSVDGVLSNSSITTTTSIPFFDSINGIWKAVRIIPVAIWDSSFVLLSERLFGEDKAIVLTILGVIIALTIIFAVVKWISTGDAR